MCTDEQLLQIRRAHRSAKPKATNPAWMNCHHDIGKLLEYIDMNSIDKKIVMKEALTKVIDACRDYLPPDGISKDEFISRVLEATDNELINEAMK